MTLNLGIFVVTNKAKQDMFHCVMVESWRLITLFNLITMFATHGGVRIPTFLPWFGWFFSTCLFCLCALLGDAHGALIECRA